ncbi:hypothetical protein TWF506_003054 [Arthrobotrys conoides]|uniref:Ankyrin repeat protein n=1 Tax=Arthrobotrys conoides TaxID=74498 RepID=A0AAN8NC54_9PEZI
MLVDQGANLEAQDKDDHTPLSRTAANGHEAVVQFLLENGADVDAKDKSGRTSLSRAAENGHFAVVRLFVEKRLGRGQR